MDDPETPSPIEAAAEAVAETLAAAWPDWLHRMLGAVASEEPPPATED
jgi:hypothetical protein